MVNDRESQQGSANTPHPFFDAERWKGEEPSAGEGVPGTALYASSKRPQPGGEAYYVVPGPVVPVDLLGVSTGGLHRNVGRTDRLAGHPEENLPPEELQAIHDREKRRVAQEIFAGLTTAEQANLLCIMGIDVKPVTPPAVEGAKAGLDAKQGLSRTTRDAKKRRGLLREGAELLDDLRLAQLSALIDVLSPDQNPAEESPNE